jgi:hypothetical protein
LELLEEEQREEQREEELYNLYLYEKDPFYEQNFIEDVEK